MEHPKGISLAAEFIQRSDFAAAHRLTSILSSSSPYGNYTELLVHQFTHSLSLRLSSSSATCPPFISLSNIPNPIYTPILPPINTLAFESEENILHSPSFWTV